jgi:GntR family transcriptional regulator, transcriptional repressor for pyruvate dehydrogenase complex
VDFFCPVKSGKISEQISRQIKEAIQRGTMKLGEKLPPARELAERFQASRISVREALNSLKTEGFVTIKPGAGTFVSEINSKRISQSLSFILRTQNTSFTALTEARIIFEPAIARLASERMVMEDFERLGQNIEDAAKALESRDLATDVNVEFHSLLARATRNPVLALTMDTVFNIWKEWSDDLRGNREKQRQAFEEAVLSHKNILEALREKDSQRAYELMLKHILRVERSFKQIKSKFEVFWHDEP